MSYTVEDYKKEAKERFLTTLSPEDRLKGLRPEDRLKGLSSADRLKMFLPAESLKQYSLNEIAKSIHIMFPELRLKEIEEILKQMKNDS